MNTKADVDPGKHEQISALMDGELTHNQVSHSINSLQGDAELRAVWSRYHLIREALRDNLPGECGHNIAKNVMARLAAEPAILAPRNIALHSKFRTLTPLFKQFAGLAVAASVTAVAILTVQGQWQAPSTSPPQMAFNQPIPNIFTPAAVPITFGPVSETIRMTVPLTPPNATTRSTRAHWDLGEPAFEAKLKRYLSHHSEHTTTVNMEGLLPYARSVSYDSDR